jgi:hypothetical protein
MTGRATERTSRADIAARLEFALEAPQRGRRGASAAFNGGDGSSFQPARIEKHAVASGAHLLETRKADAPNRSPDALPGTGLKPQHKRSLGGTACAPGDRRSSGIHLDPTAMATLSIRDPILAMVNMRPPICPTSTSLKRVIKSRATFCIYIKGAQFIRRSAGNVR